MVALANFSGMGKKKRYVLVNKAASPSTHKDYLRYFEKFLLDHPELPATRFGTLACADHGFMWKMRTGKVSYSIIKLERAVKFVEKYSSLHPRIKLMKQKVGRPTLRKGPSA